MTTSGEEQARTIPLVEERLHVAAHEGVTGRVRVSTTTETFEEVVRQELRGMRGEVVRIPVNRTLEPGEPPPAPRTERGAMIIPIFEEVLVVEKRLVLKEEVHITQHTTTKKQVEGSRPLSNDCPLLAKRNKSNQL